MSRCGLSVYADASRKALAKLGVVFVKKPSECTHLLVKSAVRTEKFLCALATAPYVLSGEWATASAAAKKLLRELPLGSLCATYANAQELQLKMTT